MIRLSLSDEDLDTLKSDLTMLRNVRQAFIEAPKVQLPQRAPLKISILERIGKTARLQAKIEEQVELQGEPTVIVSLNSLNVMPQAEEPPGASGHQPAHHGS